MSLFKGVWKLGLAFLLAIFVSACASDKPQEETPPAAEPEPVQQVEQAPEEETYTVSRGDHLWGIASKPRIYGNPYQWPLIYKANSDKIEDADLIHPGQSLTIARGMSSSEIDAAVRHAKTRGAWSIGVVEDSDREYLSR